MEVFRAVVVPVLSAYALLACVVVYASRHPDAGRPRTSIEGWRPRLRLIAVTLAGGYGCFLAIVVVFHVWVVGQHGALGSALRGGSFLAATCAATFVLGSVVESIRR
jgi:hypothetical protein